jgi:ankyrin repeat protein
MKYFSSKLSTLMLITIVVSACGKKADFKNPSADRYYGPTNEELFLKDFQEIRRALGANDIKTLKKVIAANPSLNLNQVNDDGETFLTLSIINDFRDIRNYLIDKGVNLEKTNVDKKTPLMVAASEGKLNSVKVLLDLKVDIEKKDNKGDTALHMALRQNHDEVALLLVKQGARVDIIDRFGYNALGIAQHKKSALPLSYELIKSIFDVESGAPDISSFRTVLIHADYKRLSELLSRYPKIAMDYAYEAINPLALLVDSPNESSALRSAEILLDYRANVNGPEGSEQTPLIIATLKQKKSFVYLFLSSQANPQLLDKDGRSALIHAIETNNPDIVDLLLAYSAAEKYSFRRNGKKYSYNSCTVARKVGEKLTTPEKKQANEKIKELLECGFFNWFF